MIRDWMKQFAEDVMEGIIILIAWQEGKKNPHAVCGPKA
jgi:hypothetical protein